MTQNNDQRSDLVAIIHDVRRRWRMKLALRGAALALTCMAGALILSAMGLQWNRFTPQSILLFRIVIAVVLGVVAYVFLIKPLLRSVSDEQVALYLEEHEPSLEAAIISAVEAERSGLAAHSPALVRKLVEGAVAKCRAIEHGRRVEKAHVRQYSGALGGVLVAAAAIFLLGPAYMRHALSALLVISRSVEAAAPYHIEVSPGHKTIPRGADQAITAKLIGFQADQAVLMIRKSQNTTFERVPMLRNDQTYEGTLFDVAAPVEYFVEAVGVRSPIYMLKVADMPYVQKLQLEYHFPAYTGLPPRKIEDGGDIAVLKGTEIWVRAMPTMKASGGGVVIDDKNQVPMTVENDGSLTAKFVADHNGFYRIDLDAPGGPRVNGSPKYSIDVLEDRAPVVSFTKPGRDTSASPIEEVFLEAKADDDYGVKSLDLIYSVNGGPEKTVKLFEASGTRMPTVSAGHTLYLEELSLKPGDSVSYYARATDTNTVAGPQQSLSDIYFLRIRALQKDFRKAQSQAGGGGGGGQQNSVNALSEQERQIISASFNLQRDRKKTGNDKTKEGAVVVGLMQKRLEDQVNELLTNFATRVGDQAEQFKKITDFLKQSIPEMQTASGKLQAGSPETALPTEHKALEALQKAEEEYQLQVQMGQQGGGGGGGGQQKMADELADLFQLDLDKMANQYESAQRASQQQSDQKLDELAEKLKELARRQEQEAERQLRRAQAQQGTGGGDAQRQLADQAEEAARQLEKLAREENRPQLQQTARQLQQAADAMRQAAASGDPNAPAAASKAMEQLKEAERQLENQQAGRTGRDVQDALRQAEQMAKEQQQIQNDLAKLDQQGVSRGMKQQDLSDRKQQLAGQVDQFAKQLDTMAGDMFKSERDASRKLTDAVGEIRDKRTSDKIRVSDQYLRAGQTNEAQSYDRDIQNNLDDLKNKIGEAASAVGHTKPDASQQALDKAQQLADGMQSLGERMRQQNQGNQASQNQRNQGNQGKQGNQQGQQAQNGQQSQQSQSGQQGQGQQGQQGQGQQGQGQNGQQGQQSQSGQQGQQGQNGQQGQGGQGGNGGRNQGDPTQAGRNGQGPTQGNMNGGQLGPMNGSRPGQFSPEQVRQFRAEAAQRAQDAEQLRKLLGQQKIDSKELDQIINQLHELDSARAYQDPDALAKLEQAATDNIKRFEFTLRRRLDANPNQVFLSGTDDVPEQYRKLVEQYYRSLSKNGGGKQ